MVTSQRLSGYKVAILVQNLPVPFDRRVWQESLALRDAGATVTVICPADDRHSKGEFEIDGIKVVRFGLIPEANSPLGYLREYGQSISQLTSALWRQTRRTPFDIVHICNPPDLLFAAWLPSLLLSRSRLIFDQHDLGPELVKAKHLPMSWFFIGLARLFEGVTYKLSHHVISTNESYRKKALTRGKKNPNQVTVVRSGPNKAWIQDSPATSRWHNGRAYLIGYVGVMGKQEGIEYLLKAMSALIDSHELDAQLALVGSGPDVARLKSLAGDLKVSDHVEFHGRLSDEDLRSVLSNSDVCVNPDEVNELNDLSTMNKILEYMALGKPIVQFDVTEGRESAKSASAYALANDSISFAVEIADILSDHALARTMGEFGRNRFNNELCWESQIPALINAYQNTLSGA